VRVGRDDVGVSGESVSVSILVSWNAAIMKQHESYLYCCTVIFPVCDEQIRNARCTKGTVAKLFTQP